MLLQAEKQVDERRIVEDDFKKWVKDETYFSEYVPHELAHDDHVLMRVYQYVPKEMSKGMANLTDIDGAPLMAKIFRRVLPVAKVIKVSNNVTKYKQGDLVTFSDDMCGTKINPAWLEVQEMMKERPSPEVKEWPPKYVNKLADWARHIFIGDKFKTSPEEVDAMTFLIPISFLKSAFNYKK